VLSSAEAKEMLWTVYTTREQIDSSLAFLWFSILAASKGDSSGAGGSPYSAEDLELETLIRSLAEAAAARAKAPVSVFWGLLRLPA